MPTPVKIVQSLLNLSYKYDSVALIVEKGKWHIKVMKWTESKSLSTIKDASWTPLSMVCDSPIKAIEEACTRMENDEQSGFSDKGI